jgi:amino acid adenylation domain-containing protein
VSYNLATPVYRQSRINPTALAVTCAGAEVTYAELARRAHALAATLGRSPSWLPQGRGLPRVAVLASRSIEACVAVLGASWAGGTYVPISLKAPEERLVALFERYAFSALVADAEGAKLLTARLLAACPALVVRPDAPGPVSGPSPSGTAAHRRDALPDAADVQPPHPLDEEDLAYIIFTSGTTGEPKGVMISCAAIRHYLDVIVEHFGLTASDRVLEACELSFDYSVHNMFSTWHAGGSLHILPAGHVMNAVKFARESRLTVWNSVPSLAGRLKQVRALSPGSLPDLRLTVFGGEQLPRSTVEAWRRAAPGSVIENLYGPTEATVACLCQRVEPSPAATDARDVLPIGTCLPGTEAVVLTSGREPAAAGEAGELALAGWQLAVGYLDAPELTREKFPTIAGRRWYRTGDLAMRDEDGVFHHLGRIDNQVKVLGHRVELEEVDAHLRAASAVDLVATVAWPFVNGTAQGLVAFVGSAAVDEKDLLARLKSRLPAYMVPSAVVALDPMPLSSSGKVDRNALLDLLKRSER